MNLQTDETIQNNVMDELKWDTRLRASDIGVAAKDGIVTLTGFVDSYLKKRAAEAAALRVRGVKAVANELEIHLPGSAERTDEDLAEAVVNALKWDTGIPADQIDVMVSKGWVTLKGDVEFAFEKKDAERTIRYIAGIRGVINLIRVKPRLFPSNLKEDIEKALTRNAETDAEHITVEVSGSKVSLYGTVHSYAERKAAESAVWAAPGVTEVEDRIAIAFS
ncbi:BON domain-containing protein [Ktedonobacter racemifer]|uniref:Transport-associated protein n=1 Tax=Ktedonobacter racemifer DSM 44963 TaxID=485913 RepID=D6TKZ5_KTERA|nr:BON domain-containing protein [Ktedonobacter racemifer]EFH86445.1 transport-associated protein [Ktedonobacter racemifer DSM 44963]